MNISQYLQYLESKRLFEDPQNLQADTITFINLMKVYF